MTNTKSSASWISPDQEAATALLDLRGQLEIAKSFFWLPEDGDDHG